MEKTYCCVIIKNGNGTLECAVNEKQLRRLKNEHIQR